MNQDQVKAQLLQVQHCDEYFTVIFSGKRSKKVDGLYKPETREIILHNKNFSTDHALMHTALHEYAHHLQFSASALPLSTRTHTSQFWALFHSLLQKAEQEGVYRSPFDQIPEFVELTARIKEKFLAVNGALMKDLGALLLQAKSLCQKNGTNFIDYLDRVLSIPRSSATVMMKTHLFNLDPKLGFENMRSLARIRDPEVRQEAQDALSSGKSPDMVRVQYLNPPPQEDPLRQLVLEKQRIQRYIQRLEGKLAEINQRLEAYGEDSKAR